MVHYNYLHSINSCVVASFAVSRCRWHDFRQRWKINLKHPETIDASRAAQSRGDILISFLLQLAVLITTLSITPARLFNFDETFVEAIDWTAVFLACGVEQQNIKTVAKDLFSTHLTICVCGNAEGKFTDTLFIMQGASYNANFLKGSPEGSLLAFTKKGSITEELLLMWLKHIAKKLHVTKDNPILILMDCHASRFSLRVRNRNQFLCLTVCCVADL
jgi:hypothetical protein